MLEPRVNLRGYQFHTLKHGMTMIKQYTTFGSRILVLSFYHPWIAGGAHRTRRFLTEDLARGRTVCFLYVDDLSEEAFDGRIRSEPQAGTLLLARSLSAECIRLIYPENGHRPDYSIEQFIREFAPTLIRIHNPSGVHIPLVKLAKSLGIPVLYDEMDCWNEFSRQPWGERTADWFARNCDMISTVSHYLAAQHTPSHLAVIPNGVSAEFIATCRRLRERRPPPIYREAIYTGALWPDWIDWDLIEDLVIHLPNIHFTFVGAITGTQCEDHQTGAVSRAQTLGQRKNVRFIAEIAHEELASLFANADIGLIPFICNPITLGASPLKVFDYLAADLPVVSSDLPEICSYPGVTCCDTHTAFIAAVARLCSEDNRPVTVAKMREFISNSTWSNRMDKLDQLVASWPTRKDSK